MKTGTLGAMLQGVSNQKPSARTDGTVTEQINLDPDPVRGLVSRPALHVVADLGTVPAGTKFIRQHVGGVPHILGYRPGSLQAWTTAGVPVTCSLLGSAAAYLGSDMRFTAFDGTAYVMNRAVTTAALPTTGDATVHRYTAFAVCFTGQFNRTYGVTLRYTDGSEVFVGYGTGSGAAPGTYDDANPEVIISALGSALQGHHGLKPGTTVMWKDEVLQVHYRASPITLTPIGGVSGLDSFVSFSDTLDNPAKLPRFSTHGAVVKISVTSDAKADDYYLRFNNSATSVVGNNFGQPGVWEEWFAPGEAYMLDPATMPHAITKTGGTITVQPAVWAGRQVGDSTTAPMPDFVGKPLRDVSTFQSRLVMTAGATCHMSRSERPTDLFRRTAVEQIDTDAIAISPRRDEAVTLDWIVRSDRDLLFMSDPGAGQFVISGDSKMTPADASMVQTTAYYMDAGTPPVSSGRTVLFAYSTGSYAGVYEFFTYRDQATNAAVPVTAAVTRFMRGKIRAMECSPSLGLLLSKTDNPAEQGTLYCYRFLWDGESKKVQSAWYSWEFPAPVESFWFDAAKVYVVLRVGTKCFLCLMDTDLPADGTGYHTALDFKRYSTVAAGSITLPAGDLTLVQSTGCPTLGRVIQPLSVTTSGSAFVYKLSPDKAPDGAEVLSGYPYTSVLEPTQPFERDRNGSVVLGSRLQVSFYTLDFEDTGAFSAVMRCPYRGDQTFSMDWLPIDFDPPDADSNGTRSGSATIPWGEWADGPPIRIVNHDVRPISIRELKWTGEAFRTF